MRLLVRFFTALTHFFLDRMRLSAMWVLTIYSSPSKSLIKSGSIARSQLTSARQRSDDTLPSPSENVNSQQKQQNTKRWIIGLHAKQGQVGCLGCINSSPAGMAAALSFSFAAGRCTSRSAPCSKLHAVLLTRHGKSFSTPPSQIGK